MIRQFVIILCVALAVSILSVSLASSTSGRSSIRERFYAEEPVVQEASHFDSKISEHVFRFGSVSREPEYRELPPLPRVRPGGYIQVRVFRPLPRPPFHYSSVSRII